MSIKISKSNKRFSVEFQYDEKLVEICRSIKKYYYDYEQKLWFFNNSELQNFLAALASKGYKNVEVREQIIEIVAEKDHLKVSAPFDKDLIAILRDLDGQWSRTNRYWKVPKESLDELSEKLKEKVCLFRVDNKKKQKLTDNKLGRPKGDKEISESD